METGHLSTVGRRKDDQEIARAHYGTKRVKLMDPTMVEKCHVILKKLMAHPYAEDFSQPSDPLDRSRPYYFCLKSRNMDLGTVRAKLARNLYSDVDEFKADVRLTFSNAKHYSPFSVRLCDMAEELNTLFNKQWRTSSTIGCRRLRGGDSPHYSDSKEYSPRKRRCVTPDQASRAEMLKTKFANTIVKVDEKQIVKVERKPLEEEMKPIGDREKRYNERRMQIQRQREAARIALAKMEKTVDFEDNLAVMREYAELAGHWEYSLSTPGHNCTRLCHYKHAMHFDFS